MGKVIGVKLQIRMLVERRKEILLIPLRVCIIALHKYKQMRRHRVSTKSSMPPHSYADMLSLRYNPCTV